MHSSISSQMRPSLARVYPAGQVHLQFVSVVKVKYLRLIGIRTRRSQEYFHNDPYKVHSFCRYACRIRWCRHMTCYFHWACSQDHMRTCMIPSNLYTYDGKSRDFPCIRQCLRISCYRHALSGSLPCNHKCKSPQCLYKWSLRGKPVDFLFVEILFAYTT